MHPPWRFEPLATVDEQLYMSASPKEEQLSKANSKQQSSSKDLVVRRNKTKSRAGQRLLSFEKGTLQLTNPPYWQLSTQNHGTAVPGFCLFFEFVTEEEELQLCNLLDKYDWHANKAEQERGSDAYSWSDPISGRRVQSFGATLADGFRRIDKREGDCHIPSLLQTVCSRIVQQIGYAGGFPGLDTYDLGQAHKTGLAINEYGKTDWLRFHHDNRFLFKEYLFGLSLLSDCVFSMRNASQAVDKTVDMFLPRRSLYVMTGESRYTWKHGIKRGNICGDRRISVTVRGLK